MMDELHWGDFPEISSKQWKQKIQAGLKGADYNENLIWKTQEGIDVKPFYSLEDSPPLSIPNPQHSWKICQSLHIHDPQTAHEEARNALQNGAESLCLIWPSTAIAPNTFLPPLLQTDVPIYIEPGFIDLDFARQLNTLAEEHKAQVHLHTDIIGHLSGSGNWYDNLKNDHESLANILEHSPALKTVISVDASRYQNAGATIIQQLAYALAHAAEYCHFISSSKPSTPQLNFHFKIAIGHNYFFEIAKVRALRLLWGSLASAYELSEQCHISAMPTKRNKTLYDYNVNMLRTTTECMSAVLGGVDTISNMPYDALYHKANEFGSRIARNQLLILKHESYFDKVNNPAEGAYYITSITHQLAEKALALFKQIEAGGGFLQQLKDHRIQSKIKESAAKAQEAFDQSEHILIGTNKYPNETDTMKDILEQDPFVKITNRKTLIEPIIEKRLAEKLEKERLQKES